MSRRAIATIVIACVAGIALAFVLMSRPSSVPTGASRSEAAAPSTSPSPSSTSSASLSSELLNRRWTVLFIGTDVNAERQNRGEAANTDALVLVSVNADQSHMALVSLPRDTVDVPLPDGDAWPRKINALYGERGVEALGAAIGELYGVPIDGYFAMDMDDFAAVIDALGGVDVSPPTPIADPIVNLDLAAGDQHIDGSTALGYVRTRVDQDYGRMARQQEVMVAVLDRVGESNGELDLGAIVRTAESVETDLPLDELPTLLEIARRAATAEVDSIVIQPPLITFEGDRGDGRGYVLEPDVDAIRDRVQAVIGP